MSHKKIHHVLATNTKVTNKDILVKGATEAALGAICGGVFGLLGKFSVSLFNPAVAHAAGSFATFAGVGAIAAPLMFIPKLFTDYLIEENVWLNRNPFVKEFAKDSTRLLLQLGAITAAAAMLTTPIGPTIICMMVVPTIIYILNSIRNLINFIKEANNEIPSAPVFA